MQKKNDKKLSQLQQAVIDELKKKQECQKKPSVSLADKMFPALRGKKFIKKDNLKTPQPNEQQHNNLPSYFMPPKEEKNNAVQQKIIPIDTRFDELSTIKMQLAELLAKHQYRCDKDKNSAKPWVDIKKTQDKLDGIKKYTSVLDQQVNKKKLGKIIDDMLSDKKITGHRYKGPHLGNRSKLYIDLEEFKITHDLISDDNIKNKLNNLLDKRIAAQGQVKARQVKKTELIHFKNELNKQTNPTRESLENLLTKMLKNKTINKTIGIGGYIKGSDTKRQLEEFHLQHFGGLHKADSFYFKPK